MEKQTMNTTNTANNRNEQPMRKNQRVNRAYQANRNNAWERPTPPLRVQVGEKRGKHKIMSLPAVGLMWVGYAGMVACNAAFELLRLGGTTSNQVSNDVFSWFTPAGYVFSIWSVIYLAVAVWLIFLTRDVLKARKATAAAAEADAGNAERGNATYARTPTMRNVQMPDNMLLSNKTALLFAASCALNVLWLTTWHFRMIALSVVVIAGLLGVLGLLYFQVFGSTDKLVYRVPTSVYFSWISIATAANCMHLLTRTVLGEMSILQPVMTVVLAVAFLAMAALMKGTFRDSVYGLVVVWAVVGIGVHVMPVSMPIALACFGIAAAGLAVSLIPWSDSATEAEIA